MAGKKPKGRQEESFQKGAGRGVGGRAWTWSILVLALLLGLWRGRRAAEKPSELEDEWQVITESPRIYMRDGFLTPEECDFLMKQVSGRLEPARVVEREENKYEQQVNVRNNQQIWLTYEEERDTPAISQILKRMHRAARFPDDDAEALQIGLYGIDEKYEMHPDSDPKNGVARPATLIVYLNDVAEGGETLFPLRNRSDCTMHWRRDEHGGQRFGIQNCCDEQLLRVKPQKGRAVLFFNHLADGSMDPLAEHAACQVKQGEKWIAQRWFRYEPYQRLVHPADPRFDGLPLEGLGGDPGRQTRTLSQKSPSLFLIEEFLSPAECLALEALKSSSAGVPSPVVQQILTRIDLAVLMPGSSAEVLELKSYAPAESEGFHLDEGVWSVILYLSGDGNIGEQAEGATIFPHGWCQSSLEECCQLGAQSIRQAMQKAAPVHLGMPYLVPPRRGRALLFRSTTTAGVQDPASVHGSCPGCARIVGVGCGSPLGL